MKKNMLFGYSLLISLLMVACSSAPQHKDQLLLWPIPPDEPRIAYVNTYQGEPDFKQKSFMDALFGAIPDASLLRLSKPFGVAALGDKIIVADSGKKCIFIIDPKERKVTNIGNEGMGKLSFPLGVAVSPDGTIFAADSNQQKIFAYNLEGELKTVIGGKNDFENPAGIALNNNLGRLYVVDSKQHKVRVYSVKGEFITEFGGRGSGPGEFNYPVHVTVDQRNGTVYVADTQNFRVQAFDKDGKFVRQFGKLGDGFGDFSRPKGVAVDSEGHVYVADAAFGNFQIFDEAGQVLLFVGQNGSKPGNFSLPNGIYIDEKDRIYVADSMHSSVQVFQYLSEQWKKEHPDEYKKYLLMPDQAAQASINKK